MFHVIIIVIFYLITKTTNRNLTNNKNVLNDNLNKNKNTNITETIWILLTIHISTPIRIYINSPGKNYIENGHHSHSPGSHILFKIYVHFFLFRTFIFVRATTYTRALCDIFKSVTSFQFRSHIRIKMKIEGKKDIAIGPFLAEAPLQRDQSLNIPIVTSLCVFKLRCLYYFIRYSQSIFCL